MIKNIVWNTTRTLSAIQEGHRKHVFDYLAYIFIFIPVCYAGSLNCTFWDFSLLCNRGGTTRLGNSTRLESTSISSFNSSLTRLVHQLENSQLDSTRFLISKLDNSTSDSNANAFPKILKFTTYKMKYASLFVIFSHFLQVLMIFFSCYPVPLHIESSTFKNHQKIDQKQELETRLEIEKQ